MAKPAAASDTGRGDDGGSARGAGMPHSIWAVLADSTPLNRWLVIVALLSLSVVPIVGTAAAAGFIVASAACLVLHPADSGKALVHMGPIFALPILFMLSTIWSDAPEQTLRAALQMLFTFIAAIAICRRLTASQIILILFVSSVAILLLATTTVYRSIGSGLPFLGPFASKNAMGYAAVLHLALAMAVLFDSAQRWIWRIAAVVSIPLALGLLALTQSAGGTASSATFVVLFLTLGLLGKLPLPLRLGLIALGSALAVVAAVFASDIANAVSTFRQEVLHKDATLTGRTYLWDYAAGLIRQRPMLGHGYYAFWRQGNVEAEGLWRWGGIASRSGFNFHSAVVETNVDLGLVGVIVLLGSCVVVLGAAVYRQITSPSVPLAFLAALIIVLYFRSYAESGLIAPFTLSTVLWVITAYYAFDGTTRSRRTSPPGRRGIPRVARGPRFGAGRP